MAKSGCNVKPMQMGIRVENYIVRIYRREANDPDRVVGTVECVETRSHKPFHGLDALGDLLADAGMGTVAEAKKPSASVPPDASVIDAGAKAE